MMNSDRTSVRKSFVVLDFVQIFLDYVSNSKHDLDPAKPSFGPIGAKYLVVLDRCRGGQGGNNDNILKQEITLYDRLLFSVRLF